MAEADGNVNNQRKRRLPEWMSRTSSSDKEKQTEQGADKPHSLPSSDRAISVEFIVKEKDLEPKKKLSISHNNVSDTTVGWSEKSSLQKRPPKVKSKTVRRAKKISSTSEVKDGNDGSGVLSSGQIEDELELTVDDLITIAREYVKANEAVKRSGRSTQASKSQFINPSSLSLSERSCDGASDIVFESSTTHPHGSEVMPKTKRYNSDNLELGGEATTSSRSSDAAQDMLDLFFGPLLKKPDPESRRLETIAADGMVWTSVDTGKHTECQTAVFLEPLIKKPDLKDWKSEISVADDMNWACATTSAHVAAEADGTEVVVVEKKKSSLKDKVNMLLD